jgi:deferrochelatase/peroxidase EfeB
MTRLSRRGFLGAAGAAASGAALGAVGRGFLDEDAARAAIEEVPFHGRHQAGIATPPQAHLAFAAFDVTAADVVALRSLLRVWTRAAARLSRGETVGNAPGSGPARLTVTFGLGPSLFDGRFGLSSRRPGALAELPAFRGEEFEAGRSGGDLAVQACANDPAVAFDAVRALSELARGTAVVRWLQRGFRGSASDGVVRNLIGFRDGTNNLDAADERAMAQHVWVQEPSWMRDGTYMVVRRIRLRIEHWDSVTLAEQERTIGRRRASGATIAAPNSHVSVARGRRHERILRRSYSIADGLDRQFGELEAGLFFVCFQQDPGRQFVPIQRRLAAHDHLNEYTFHTASAVFAIPPGSRRGGSVGAGLLG